MTNYHIISSGTAKDYAFVGCLIRVVIPDDQRHYQGIRELVFEVQQRVESDGRIKLYTRVDRAAITNNNHLIAVKPTTPVDVLVETLTADDEPTTLGTVITARSTPDQARPEFYTRARSQEAGWVLDGKDNTFYTWSTLIRTYPIITTYAEPTTSAD